MAAEANVLEVRRIWKVWQREGLEAVWASVPEDVEWLPYSARGRKLSGTSEVREFWAGRCGDETLTAELAEVEAVEPDAVVATGALRRETARATSTVQVAWLYCFDRGRLRLASGHSSAAEARESARRIRLTPVIHPPRAETAFSVDARRENGHVVIAPVGELDFASARGLTRAIEQAAVPGGRIVIDLAGVPFMDSCGLRSLFDALRASRSGGWELAVRPGPESVKRLIALAGADRLLPLEHAA